MGAGHPKVAMAFRNTRTKVGTTHSRPRLTTVEKVLYEAENLFGTHGSWMKLENFAGQSCSIRWSGGYCTADLPGSSAAKLDKAELIERINSFVAGGFVCKISDTTGEGRRSG
jgi:hypothetical protein